MGEPTAPATPARRARLARSAALLVMAVAACVPTEPERMVFVDGRLGVDTLVAGDWTAVTVRVGNAGKEPIRLLDYPCSSFRFRVLDPAGAEVYPAGASWECGEWAATPPVEPALYLPAGIIDSVTHAWRAVHGYNTADGSGDPLAPGLYRVVPLVVLGGWEEVEGEPLELVITEATAGEFAGR